MTRWSGTSIGFTKTAHEVDPLQLKEDGWTSGDGKTPQYEALVGDQGDIGRLDGEGRLLNRR